MFICFGIHEHFANESKYLNLDRFIRMNPKCILMNPFKNITYMVVCMVDWELWFALRWLKKHLNNAYLITVCDKEYYSILLFFLYRPFSFLDESSNRWGILCAFGSITTYLFQFVLKSFSFDFPIWAKSKTLRFLKNTSQTTKYGSMTHTQATC